MSHCLVSSEFSGGPGGPLFGQGSIGWSLSTLVSKGRGDGPTLDRPKVDFLHDGLYFLSHCSHTPCPSLDLLSAFPPVWKGIPDTA